MDRTHSTIDEVIELPVHRHRQTCPKCGGSINQRWTFVEVSRAQGFLVGDCGQCCMKWRTTKRCRSYRNLGRLPEGGAYA